MKRNEEETGVETPKTTLATNKQEKVEGSKAGDEREHETKKEASKA